MNPASILLYVLDWRGVLNRAAYRRNMSILVLVGLLIRRLDLFPEGVSLGWAAVAAAMGLSFDARRYHDMGRSAAWIAWANLIGAALAIVVFQFIPNVLDYVPLPEDWRPDATGQAMFGRFALPALVGVAFGNAAQSIWLATAPSLVGENPYARLAAVDRRAGDKDAEGPDEAALQAMIDRHLANRQIETPQPDAAPPAAAKRARDVLAQSAPRQFGRRGR